MTNEKTIRVMGTGNISIQPDTTCLRFRVDALHKDYAKAYEAAALGNADLRAALVRLGLDPNSLKTEHFDIRKEFESKHTKGTWTQEFKGFKLYQNLKLEIPIDGRLTSQVLVELGKAWPELEVEISYIRKDVENAKLDMLANAVKDAKKKATVMASALGYELGELVSIDYSKRSLDISYREEKMMCCEEMVMSKCSPSLDINPEDIDAADTVETVWMVR